MINNMQLNGNLNNDMMDMSFIKEEMDHLKHLSEQYALNVACNDESTCILILDEIFTINEKIAAYLSDIYIRRMALKQAIKEECQYAVLHA